MQAEVAVKKKKTTANQTLNRTGVRQLSRDEDLSLLFSGNQEQPDTAKGFSELLEESLRQPGGGCWPLKPEQAVAPDRKPLPVHEQIKHYPRPQDELDLHGHTAEAAAEKIDAFLQAARLRGIRTVRLVVGRGRHSRVAAVLPDVAEQKVVALKKQGLLRTFVWERRCKLSSGALIVYL